MYRVSVSDHAMIAHSLRGAVFGPAQRLHGATYVVEVILSRRTLGEDGIVADIGALRTLLEEVLEPIRYRNLDELPELRTLNTTTEALAHHVHGRLAERIREGALGEDGAHLETMEVVLRESPVAWASYCAPP